MIMNKRYKVTFLKIETNDITQLEINQISVLNDP